jgi:hypothetical protein
MGKKLEYICSFRNCSNVPYKEVYALKMRGKESIGLNWWYLCRKHFYAEQKRKDKKFNCYCKAEK